MSYELDKIYNPKSYEADIYQQWEQSGAFKPDSNKALRSHSSDAPQEDTEQQSKAYKDVRRASSGSGAAAERRDMAPFTVIMPPPNSNGDLHSGHGMFVVTDILARFKRMQGHPTLWLPGTDHAGIETQVVFERELAKDGKSRFDLGREKFYDQALAFTLGNQPKMISQLRSLGFSADWSRLKFTLDPDIIETVYATFKQMHDDGLVYRGNRIVNWCTQCRSSFADIEIKHVDREDAMYTLDYDTVQIATTRPETIFADAAVAVNPADERHAKLIGQTAIIPLIDRPVAIIGDDYVELGVGTGALKVTPAHDVNDYEIGLRHNLPEISVVDLDGKLINVPEEFAGMTVAEGRKAVVAALEATGKLVATTPLTHSVGIHDRCGTVIEPLITEQWYLRIEGLNEPVIEAFEADEVAITPVRFKKITLDWLRNEHDWNIGRQNWFGIRIPVFYKESNDPTKDAYIITADENEAKTYYGEGNYRAETDVFDTWFSSSQWPYATLMSTGDFDRGFYPTDVMMTARDILTKWVTRMVMFSLYRTKQIPFRNVYLWGMVNDAHGKKMSKSKGNVINPLEMTDKYGTDALRLALTIGITPGNDGSLSEAKIEGYRNFCNKLWNVARFILGQLPEDYSPAWSADRPAEPKPESPADEWIMAKLDAATHDVTEAIEAYHFSEAGQTVYSLLWDDFADWYVEAAKVHANYDVLLHGLETILKLAHPLAPFVTEAIWRAFPWHKDQLILTPWPKANKDRTNRTAAFEQIQEVVSATRTLSSEEQLSKPILLTTNEQLAQSSELIERLARVGKVKLVEKGSGLYLGTSTGAWIEADNELINARKHRLKQQHGEKQAYLKSLDARLANKSYVESAPEKIVQDTRNRREETLMLLSKLDEQLAALNQSK